MLYVGGEVTEEVMEVKLSPDVKEGKEDDYRCGVVHKNIKHRRKGKNIHKTGLLSNTQIVL